MWVWVRVRACVRCCGASCVAGAALAAWAAPPSLSQWPVARPLSTQLTASPRLAQANALSVEFLVAFGNELGERLDIRQRVRSTTLMADELHTLRTPPFAALVDQGMLGMFQ